MAASVNRYPDSGGFELTAAIAAHHDVPVESVWVGAGSTENLGCTALAVGGPGTSAVYAAPSFVMYAISTRIAHSEPVTVPLTESFDLDLEAMASAIRRDTTIVYVCNPNNPTGGMRSGADLRSFIEAVPDAVSVVIDEAYAEYVTDAMYESMLHASLDKPNVLVTRTFSKIYGLAGLRVGYAVGHPELVEMLRTPQPPFSVNTMGQAGAIEALRHQDRVAERRQRNDEGRAVLIEGLRGRGVDVAPSQANFVYFQPDTDPNVLSDALMRRGEIVRVLGDGVRVTVGSQDENARFLEAWDAIGVPIA
jgi:histidinol-phosphate aminotransferase